MSKPLAIDLFCGLGGWAQGFLSEGWDVIGFDIERHDYGTGGYPGQLILQDVLTLDGRQFRNADLIVASPPCQEFSYMAMPWTRAKEKAAKIRASQMEWARLTRLFWACFRIAREAGLPLIVENVKGAQPWLGAARWHFGSFYLWGDVPALMPTTLSAPKVCGFSWSDYGNPDYVPRGFNVEAEKAIKNNGGSWFAIGSPRQKELEQNPDGRKVPTDGPGRCTDVGNGARFTTRDCGNEKGFAKEWRDSPNGMPMMSSRSSARKAASAQIAKIPFPLAQYIARVFKP